MVLTSPVERTIQRQQVKWLSYWFFFPLAFVSAGFFYYSCCGSLETLLKIWPSSFIEQLAWVAVFFLAYVLGIGLHELFHGLTWITLARSGWKALRFGVFSQSGIPYCHLKKPVRRNVYLTGVVMPGLLLGVVPVLLGLWYGNMPLLVLGLFLTHAALSDAVMAGYLLREKPGSLIKDQPHALGYWVYPPGAVFPENDKDP